MEDYFMQFLEMVEKLKSKPYIQVLKTMERYVPGFLSIVYGSQTPEEALAVLEE